MSKHKLVALVMAEAIVLALSGGCTNKSTTESVEAPREVLRQYVAEAFAVKDVKDVANLKKYVVAGGDAYKDLEKLEKDQALFDETFKKQKIESASSLKIRDEKKIDDSHYSITYEIAYWDQTQKEEVKEAPPVSPSGQSHAGETVVKEAGKDLVTTKKYVIFERTEEKGETTPRWRIAQVTNIKTAIEHSDENISATPQAPKSN